MHFKLKLNSLFKVLLRSNSEYFSILVEGKEGVTLFSQVKAHMANFSYDFAHFDQLLLSFCGLFFVLWILGSRCVVQDCSHGYNRAAGILLHASPNNKNMRDVWARFVRMKRKNFHLLPKTRFVIARFTLKKAVLLGLWTQVSAAK